MKKYFIAAAVLMICLSACGTDYRKTETETETVGTGGYSEASGEALRVYYTFEELIQRSDVGLKAVCTGKEVFDDFADVVFSVNEVFWGTAEKEIRVRTTHGNNHSLSDLGDSDAAFSVDEEYFIAAEKHSSIIYTHKDLYLINGGLIVSLTEGKVRCNGENVEIPQGESIPEYFLSIYRQVPHKTENVIRPVYENSFEEMWNESEYVVRILPDVLDFDGPGMATNSYQAQVLEQYKGDPINTDKVIGGRIHVALLKETVTLGSEYIVGISGAQKGDKYTLVYCQETESSVYPVNEEILEKIRSKIG